MKKQTLIGLGMLVTGVSWQQVNSYQHEWYNWLIFVFGVLVANYIFNKIEG